VKITSDDLKKAIKLYNYSRKLLDRFEELRTLDAPPFSGEEALAVILAGTTMPGRSTTSSWSNLLPKRTSSRNQESGAPDARGERQR